MDIVDLNVTSEGVILDELAALDLSGQEIFECAAVQDVEITVKPEDTAYDQDAILLDHTPFVSQANRSIEGSGQDARNIAISHMPKSRRVATESVEERLQRIKNDLMELSDLNPERLGANNLMELENIRALHHKLTQLSADQLEEMQTTLLGEPKLTDGSIAVTLPRVKLDGRDLQKLLELDRKISRLERVVGPVETLGKSILTKLDEFKSQSDLLCDDNEMLEKFHERLLRIEEDYENSLLGRKSKTSPSLYQTSKDGMASYESKINDLHRFNSVLQAYGPILPQLTERVEQISAIDDKLSGCLESAKSTVDCIQELRQQAQKWEQVTNNLEQKLTAQETELENNKEHFNQLLANLESKLKSYRDVKPISTSTT